MNPITKTSKEARELLGIAGDDARWRFMKSGRYQSVHAWSKATWIPRGFAEANLGENGGDLC